MNDLFAPLYEGWGLFYLDNFSDDLYNARLYIPIGLTMLLSSLALMGVYYYVINHTPLQSVVPLATLRSPDRLTQLRSSLFYQLQRNQSAIRTGPL